MYFRKTERLESKPKKLISYCFRIEKNYEMISKLLQNLQKRFCHAEKINVERGREMTIQECYQQFGGDFDEIMTRLPSETLVKKFITKFLDDSSFPNLQAAMEEGSREKAFRAVHTLKGVCANLNMNRLMLSASKLTELLRPETEEIPAGADELFEEVRRDYELTVSAIRAYIGEH